MAILVPTKDRPGTFDVMESGQVVSKGHFEIDLVHNGARHGSVKFVTEERHEPTNPAAAELARQLREAEVPQ